MVSPIQNLPSIPRVRVRMKATMNSQTLMMKMKRDLTKKAVLVTLKKFNQGLPDQTHRGNNDAPSDIFGSKDAALLRKINFFDLSNVHGWALYIVSLYDLQKM